MYAVHAHDCQWMTQTHLILRISQSFFSCFKKKFFYVKLTIPIFLSVFSLQLRVELRLPSSLTRTWTCSQHPSWTTSWHPLAGLSICSVLASASLEWSPSWLASPLQRTPSVAWFSASLPPSLWTRVDSLPTTTFRSKVRLMPRLILVSLWSPPVDTRWYVSRSGMTVHCHGPTDVLPFCSTSRFWINFFMFSLSLSHPHL